MYKFNIKDILCFCDLNMNKFNNKTKTKINKWFLSYY